MERPVPVAKSNILTFLIVTPPILVVFYIIGWSLYESWWEVTLAVGSYVIFGIIYLILTKVRGKSPEVPESASVNSSKRRVEDDSDDEKERLVK